MIRGDIMSDKYSYSEKCANFLVENGFYVIPCCDWRDPEIREQKGAYPKKPFWHFSNEKGLTKDVLPRYFYSTPRFKRWKSSPYGEYYPKTTCFAIRTGLYTGRIGALNGKYLIGLDCDNKNGHNGVEVFRERFGINDHDTFSVETATNGGRHFYFASDVPVANATHILPGVDIRGTHGLLYAPGSSYLNENLEELSYRTIERDLAKIAPIPQALLTFLDKNKCLDTEKTAPVIVNSSSFSDDSIRCDEEILRKMVSDCVLDGEISKETMTPERLAQVRKEAHDILLNTLLEIRNEVVGRRNDSLFRKGALVFSLAPRYITIRSAETLLRFAASEPDRVKAEFSIRSAFCSEKARSPYAFCRDFNLPVKGYWCRSDPLFREKFGIPTDFGRIQKAFNSLINSLDGEVKSFEFSDFLYREMKLLRNTFEDDLNEQFYESTERVFSHVPKNISKEKAEDFFRFVARDLPVDIETILEELNEICPKKISKCTYAPAI